VRSEGETTTIDVLDEGSGVQPEHVHELFLPFARFSTRTDSTGLGLAICRTIVEAHGGTIRYSRVQGGRRTRFRVRLPADAA
jgi:signal transduction histidine kinase